MILICGGSGFVGRHVVSELVKDGQAVRCLIRAQSNKEPLEKLGVELAMGDITAPKTLPSVLTGVDTVIHLVGIIREVKEATFQKIHVEGTTNLVEAAKKAGVKKFIYISALGTRPQAASLYHQTKYAAEQRIIGSGITYTIFRPSVMYGVGGEFIGMLLKMIKAPIVPIVGSGQNKMQMLYVGDLAKYIAKSVTLKKAENQIIEIAGPIVMSYEALLRLVMKAADRHPLPVKLPLFFVKPQVKLMELALSKPPLTSDQLIMLQEDSFCDPEPVAKMFNLPLTDMEQWLTAHISDL